MTGSTTAKYSDSNSTKWLLVYDLDNLDTVTLEYSDSNGTKWLLVYGLAGQTRQSDSIGRK